MSLADAMHKLYKSKNENGDITFLVHGNEVKAHKLILETRSDVFKAMFASNRVDDAGRFRFGDPAVNVYDFEEFIRFLYTDEIACNYDNMAALIRLSEMYFVPLLEQKCFDVANMVIQEFVAVASEDDVFSHIMNVVEETLQEKGTVLICTKDPEFFDAIETELRQGFPEGEAVITTPYPFDDPFFTTPPLGHCIYCSTNSDVYDVKDTDVIINADLPLDIHCYKNRIGYYGPFNTTQRRAITFINDYEPVLDEIVVMMRDHHLEVPDVLYAFINGR